ncbi:TPA: hypothetical protein DCG61_02475 [Patescibacteria group bacterium]|jgi:hypothetical protein|nr:hypothetical protein [Patescibacteria group bacterium]
MGRAYREKKRQEKAQQQEERLIEAGWTKIAPGAWAGKSEGWDGRPFIGPRTIEAQNQVDRWKKFFKEIADRANQ